MHSIYWFVPCQAGWGPRWNPGAARHTEGSRNTGGRYHGDGGTGEGCIPLPAALEALGSQLACEAHAMTPVFRPRHAGEREGVGGVPLRGALEPRGSAVSRPLCTEGTQTPKLTDPAQVSCPREQDEGTGGGGGGRGRGGGEVAFRPNVCNINYYPVSTCLPFPLPMLLTERLASVASLVSVSLARTCIRFDS